jgi:hypothetical protein
MLNIDIVYVVMSELGYNKPDGVTFLIAWRTEYELKFDESRRGQIMEYGDFCHVYK